MCRVGELISEQAYIFKKQRFIEVFEREIEDRRGMSWLSLVLILGGLNDLFNLLLFLAEIFFTSSVTLHHSTSLIFHRGFPAVPLTFCSLPFWLLSISASPASTDHLGYKHNFPYIPIMSSQVSRWTLRHHKGGAFTNDYYHF